MLTGITAVSVRAHEYLGAAHEDPAAVDTTKLRLCCVRFAFLSISPATKEKVPATVGTPLSSPVELLSCNPDGSDPETTLHWYGVWPPVADKLSLNEVPTVAEFKAVVVIFGEDTEGATFTIADACLLLSAALVAVTVSCVAEAGATSMPLVEMLPAVVDQMTPV